MLQKTGITITRVKMDKGKLVASQPAQKPKPPLEPKIKIKPRRYSVPLNSKLLSNKKVSFFVLPHCFRPTALECRHKGSGAKACVQDQQGGAKACVQDQQHRE